MAGVWHIPFEKPDGILEQAPLHLISSEKTKKEESPD
jgi:hypothetical protein